MDSFNQIVFDRQKRIEELERLLEEQRKLRVQDASQVEEKAARIKEWVANKLKELENQNRLLRDQNRKQKEIIDIMTKQMASLKMANSLQQNTEKTSQSSNKEKSPVKTIDTGFKQSKKEATSESPIYDSVNIETNQQYLNLNQQKPPPPPLHQSDKWELQLYNLADQTLSNLIKAESDNVSSLSDSRKSSLSSKNDLILLVKPTFTTIDGDHVVDSSLDYDQSLDYSDENRDQNQIDKSNSNNTIINSPAQAKSSQLIANPKRHLLLRKESFDSCGGGDSDSVSAHANNGPFGNSIGGKSLVPNLFDSPMRTKAGCKDASILRTQSVRKNPAPGKLYDYILADLVKRGYLMKSGALKNHNRWFVLKNFHLYSYKSEAEETLKATPHSKIRLDFNCQIHHQQNSSSHSSSDTSFPFKITYLDKTLQLIASSAQIRDEWIRILTFTINMSDIEPDTLTKNNSIYEGIVSITKHGHIKRCYAILVNHILFFLKSLTDPTPMSYISVKEARIREVTDSYDYDLDEQEEFKQKNNLQDCSLAIYPKFCMIADPVYLTLGSQQETDKWLYFLSSASGLDQSHGTQFERALTKIMINSSISTMNLGNSSNNNDSLFGSDGIGCLWKEHSLMLYSDRPISQPLTSLPNETLQSEAIELFKSIQLFTKVPLEPVAIDYHVSLLKNCLGCFLKYPELRNEFYAQLIKQSTWILHRCGSPKSSISNGSDNSPTNRSSLSSISPRSSECQFLTDARHVEEKTIQRRRFRSSISSNQLHCSKEKNVTLQASVSDEYEVLPPTHSELIQTMQILAIAVSLNIPRGRMRWWLIDHLKKFADPDTEIGKYALYNLRAIDRTISNGTRDNVPSRTEIMSILLRNPYDHSNPHSLPINFCDGSYLVIGADGSTTVEEFLNSMTTNLNVRHSLKSDFYLFADDPSGSSRDLHILEPKRKVLDIVGWWEDAFRKHNSGRYQNTKFIKLICKKRLVLKAESEETAQERLLILHQINQEIVAGAIPLDESLAVKLGAIMAQLTLGDFDKNPNDAKRIKCILEKVTTSFLPATNKTKHQIEDESKYYQLLDSWQQLSGKSSQDCVRVYLNCIRRLNIGQ